MLDTIKIDYKVTLNNESGKLERGEFKDLTLWGSSSGWSKSRNKYGREMSCITRILMK